MIDEKEKEKMQVHAQCLLIPVLDGFEQAEATEPQTILSMRSNDKMFKQTLVSYGEVKGNLPIEELSRQIIEQEKQSTTSNDGVDYENFYYKTIKNADFEFVVYVSDFGLDYIGQKRVVRKISAFFIEKHYNDLYDLSLTMGPMLQNGLIQLGTLNVDTDLSTKALVEMFEVIINNIQYNKEYLQ